MDTNSIQDFEAITKPLVLEIDQTRMRNDEMRLDEVRGSLITGKSTLFARLLHHMIRG